LLTLNQMEIFYFVATWKSFSRAALELGFSKGYVSTQVTALEKNLGTKLLHRTTRHLSITEEGTLFLDSCAKIVGEKKLAASRLKDSKDVASGHLTITAPPSMCATFLAELLPKFQKLYPQITLTVDSSSKVLNLLQHGIDLALRATPIPDENCVARLITTFNFAVCATPKYLQENKIPKNPADLLRHNCLIYSADPAQNRWPFQMKNKVDFITAQGNLTSADSTVIKSALLANQGIVRLPRYVLAKEIANKKLTELFAENMKIDMPLYAIYSSNPNTPPKIKCFIKFLNEHFQGSN